MPLHYWNAVKKTFCLLEMVDLLLYLIFNRSLCREKNAVKQQNGQILNKKKRHSRKVWKCVTYGKFDLRIVSLLAQLFQGNLCFGKSFMLYSFNSGNWYSLNVGAFVEEWKLVLFKCGSIWWRGSLCYIVSTWWLYPYQIGSVQFVTYAISFGRKANFAGKYLQFSKRFT